MPDFRSDMSTAFLMPYVQYIFFNPYSNGVLLDTRQHITKYKYLTFNIIPLPYLDDIIIIPLPYLDDINIIPLPYLDDINIIPLPYLDDINIIPLPYLDDINILLAKYILKLTIL